MPTPVSAADLLASPEITPGDTILTPLLSSPNLALLYGPRGIGKSYLALGIAWATAAGDSFLKWQANRLRKVLYVDGELTGVELRQRLASFGAPPPGLQFLTAGVHGSGLPDLLSWEPWTEDGLPDLVVVDSLSSLIAEQRPSAERWAGVRHWLLEMRRLGVVALVVHHATRRGAPRGPNPFEDVFDVVMVLRPPPGYRPRDGLRAELHFEKARGLHGAAVDPFEARMATDAKGRAHWGWRPTGSAELHRVAVLLQRGLNPNQVARELGISKSKSYRLREQALLDGLLQSR